MELTLGRARKWHISKRIAEGIIMGFCSLDSVRICENSGGRLRKLGSIAKCRQEATGSEEKPQRNPRSGACRSSRDSWGFAELPVAAEVARVAEALSAVFADVAALVQASEIKNKFKTLATS